MLQLTDINAGKVLLGLNLTVEQGEFVLIIGDNGAGKTTLFNVISGSLKPENGKIFIDKQEVTDWPQHARASLVANVFQDPKVGTIGSMTIRENLDLAYKRGKTRSLSVHNTRIRDDFYREKLRMLHMNLENRLDSYAEELSGGQRQALSVIMSTLTEAKTLLFDEITASLDRQTSENILRIIETVLVPEKKTCLMITHDASHIERLGDRALILRDGRLVGADVN
jgi:putative ABC transport system ATP-binding protein